MSSLKTINCRHGKMCSRSSSAGLVNWQYLALIVLTGQLLLDCSSTADPSYDKPSPISIYYTLVFIVYQIGKVHTECPQGINTCSMYQAVL